MGFVFKNEVYAVDESGETYLVDTKGCVLDKIAKNKSNLVHGVGVNDWLFVTGSKEGGIASAYQYWQNMLKRGYDTKFKTKHPTYDGVCVCSEWLSFTSFFADTKSYMKRGWCLDKDLLFYENKEYNKKVCIFAPTWLNTLLINCGSARGVLPQGVSWYSPRGKYVAQCAVDGKQRNLGYFTNIEDASNAYINFKIAYIESKRGAIEVVAMHNDLHVRFGLDFSLADIIIENFKKQVGILI